MKYDIPDFLKSKISRKVYLRWLDRKSAAHVKRDKARGKKAAYKEAIHKAVWKSGGRDVYTGEELAWDLISKYNNDASEKDGRRYKAGFALLPTVDHVHRGIEPPEFEICAWRTNDAKNDLPFEEFVSLCRRVIQHCSRGGERCAGQTPREQMCLTEQA